MRPLGRVMCGAAVVVGVLALAAPVAGNPHSLNVAVVDSMSSENGGTLPTISGFNFTVLPVASVDAAHLSLYDTVLLNIASYGVNCNPLAISAGGRSDLLAFVHNGGKLIIYDSECKPNVGVDYSWLPFPFTTSNPGQLGSHNGVLTIVEENVLSSGNAASPYYIDAAAIASATDAVGDMNVMVTRDNNWCLDMSGTNALNITGPVHAYARYGNGLIIYNGLDMDYLDVADPPNGLAKIFQLELGVAFNPVPALDLPCGVPVNGIKVDPNDVVMPLGAQHTVTATVVNQLNAPQPNVHVTFTVLSGPNAGAPVVCTASPACLTDANGQVSFTYAGVGGLGQDVIQGCFTDAFGQPVCDDARVTWVAPPGSLRTSDVSKGSLLVYPKVEIRWDAAGHVVQDTFLTLANDYPADVPVWVFFVAENGARLANDLVLTHNEAAYWSLLTGLPKGVTPFPTVTPPVAVEPNDPASDKVLRGYVLAWATDYEHTPVRWNHLSGGANIVNYRNVDAAEYNAYAFAALGPGANGAGLGAAGGELRLDGVQYDNGFANLLLDFFASGSHALSGALTPAPVTHDTELTLLVLSQDLRQDAPGPNVTKAVFEIYNANELSVAGAEFCVTRWSQALLSAHGGFFDVGQLQTDKGRARITGVQSVLCPSSAAQALLGVATRVLTFAGGEIATSSVELFGAGVRSARIVYDSVGPPPPELRTGAAVEGAPVRVSGRVRTD